jgi:phosphomannomutase
MISGYVSAYSAMLPRGPVVVGRDGRRSGNWIEKIAVGTLLSLGREVRVIGMAPTPTVQLMTEKSDAAGGISITASHNPGEWNGLKFLNAEGVFLGDEENAELFSKVDNEQYSYPAELPNHINEIIINDADLSHINSVLGLSFLGEGKVSDLLERKLRFVVDAVNASGSRFVPKLLEMLGTECIELYCDGSGVFPHTPEPLESNLADLMESVKENKADAGIAVDPDADRLVLIDEKGRAIGEEKTIALATKAVLSAMQQRGEDTSGSVITVNLSTSRMVDDIAAEYGARVERSPVGEINVVKKMKENASVIGGEGSGGVILPECHYGRDSLVGIALIASLLAGGKTLSELSSEIKDYHIIKEKQAFDGDISELVGKIKDSGEYDNAKADTSDGIRIDFDNSWVQLRASNTEPIIRIIAEAPIEEESKKLIDNIKKFV